MERVYGAGCKQDQVRNNAVCHIGQEASYNSNIDLNNRKSGEARAQVTPVIFKPEYDEAIFSDTGEPLIAVRASVNVDQMDDQLILAD